MLKDFSDCRGEVRYLDCGGKIVSLIHTVRGALRSGDVHPVAQHDALIQGLVAIEADAAISCIHPKNPTIVIPAGVPHLFRSITDSWVVEWWDGPFSAEYYAPYREQVEAWMKEHGDG